MMPQIVDCPEEALGLAPHEDILVCPHEDRSIWTKLDDVIAQAPNGDKFVVKWLVVCAACEQEEQVDWQRARRVQEGVA